MGRDSVYSHSIARDICEGLASGKSLRSVCEAEGMPTEAAVRGWVIRDEQGFSSQYTRAREIQARTFAEELVDIADTETDPQRARVRIDARKWVASKILPKQYGDKLDLNHSGEIGGGTVRDRSEADIVKRLAELEAAKG